MIYTPRDYQDEANDSVFQYFLDGKKGNPLVVAPTGSGKSIMVADFCRRVLFKWSTQKILVISHSKEILKQNHSKLVSQIPNTKIGLWSSGLKSKTLGSVTVAGIQSIYNKPEIFDDFNLIIVDECHSIPHKKGGRYHKFFEQVEKPVIGFTATPYRLGAGYLHLGDDAFFDDIVYTINIKDLQDVGHLCRVTSKGTETGMDASKIKKQAGDFILKELSAAFDRDSITQDIVEELLKYKDLRKKWLLFAIDIEHCENIAAELNKQGVRTAVVHSKMKANRDDIIELYKADKYQCLVSVAVLTTGFDVPAIDLIGLLRPTQSPTLHVQIIGRGLRPCPEKKENLLVLDFAGNLIRNGPIDNPRITVRGTGSGAPIMKQCDGCAEIVHAAVRICPVCGAEFQFKHHLSAEAKEGKVIEEDTWHDVETVHYETYTGSKGIPMMMVTYDCGLRCFHEYVCIEHIGPGRAMAERWWSRRSFEDTPDFTIQAVEKSDSLMKPKRIMVYEGGKYKNIKDHEF